jgi:hypothetical protein
MTAIQVTSIHNVRTLSPAGCPIRQGSTPGRGGDVFCSTASVQVSNGYWVRFYSMVRQLERKANHSSSYIVDVKNELTYAASSPPHVSNSVTIDLVRQGSNAFDMCSGSAGSNFVVVLSLFRQMPG